MIRLNRNFFFILSFVILTGQICTSQPCITGDYHFYKQSQIDSFPILYPGCTEISGAVRISSDSSVISNLLGLSTLESISGDLQIINNPLLENLSGLNGLETIGGFFYIENNSVLTDITALSKLKDFNHYLSIHSNSSLESLSGLENLEFELHDNLSVSENPQLTHCDIQSICEHISRYGYSRVFHNGSGCNYIEEVYLSCNPGSDSLHLNDEICFEDGFEEWAISSDSLFPSYWQIVPPGLWITEGIPSVERVPSLNEGNYALLMRSNGPGFEGPEKTSIERNLCGLPSSVDIGFTYTCRGEGSCRIFLGQATDTTGGVNWRPIWDGYTWDTVKRTVVLNNIPVNPPFSGFQRIRIATYPIYWAGGSYGISEFTIDSLVIKEHHTTTSTKAEDIQQSNHTAYPNPSDGQFHLHPAPIDGSTNIVVISMDGQIVLKQTYMGSIDISAFPDGMYFVSLIQGKNWNTLKVVKH